MRYYIIAGEASGDLHASRMIAELRKLDRAAEVRGWGGDLMQHEGVTIVKHFRELAFTGIKQVILNLPAILGHVKLCKKDIAKYKPDVIILVDYPGFNMRIADWAKKHGFKVIYYIVPKVWAWREGRIKILKRAVDKMLLILPFEKEYFEAHGFNVEYVGYPLVDVIERFKENASATSADVKPSGRVITIMPGSRKHELKYKLPMMLKVTTFFPEEKFVIAKAPGLDDEFYKSFMGPYKNVEAVRGSTYDLLYNSKAAIVQASTASLEAGLFRVPQVACYKTDFLMEIVGRMSLKVKYFSLVNLILKREAIKELLQWDLTVENLEKELRLILEDKEKREKIGRDYDELLAILKPAGDASLNAARAVYAFVKNLNFY